MEVDGVYPVCGALEDGLEHILVECMFARLVWALSGIPSGCVLHNGLEMEDWIGQVHRNLLRSDFAIILTL
ncbi:UNVERIFIED_CONTAM: hypothetical protein Sradi_3213800 [Sesamum radiatum]|uniref:Reverse transcriptase zinc-binding domain-containing protein n=1 Tax=Sesamum radiatum TaxID=300843 RepID=A0AAW2RHZ3_SESRA